jgi:hypothetical protein
MDRRHSSNMTEFKAYTSTFIEEKLLKKNEATPDSNLLAILLTEA